MFQESQASGLPEYVKIVEVGPRDGLQNEKVISFFCVCVYLDMDISFFSLCKIHVSCSSYFFHFIQ